MNFSSRFKYVRHFFGLGIGGDLSTICDDRVMWAWTSLHLKVFFGVFIWMVDVQVSRKRKAVLCDSSIEQSLKKETV